VPPSVTTTLVFACLFGAALLGMRLRAVLPAHHLSHEAKESVRVGMGSVATMAALVLGLLVASTKSAYDTEKSEVTQMGAKVVYLDRVLENYGPEAAEPRELLRLSLESAIGSMWSGQKSGHPAEPSVLWTQTLPNAIQKLSPRDERQGALKAQAAQIAGALAEMRWLLFEQGETSISTPLLVIVISWLAIIFLSMGLYAPSNYTVVAALFLAALSVTGAIFLILELDMPFDGIIRISSEPMRNALQHLGR
jgi:hypothetical protein